MKITKVAVIGSGVMGSGIAAQVANAGFPVVLLDRVPDGTESRNQLAETAVAHQLKIGGFMHASAASLITTGNLEDNLDLLSDVDWIVEAVIEQIDIKTDLYRRIDQVRQKGSIVSSNTSTIPLHLLTEGQSESFQNDFLITHFFNPPRHMRLLELVAGSQTRADARQQVREFADYQLGKSVVDCKDTPGFIANRIGIYWLQSGLLSAIQHGVSVEEADAVMSRPVGIPKTGLFGLWDLIGIDLGPHLIKSLITTLNPSDPFHQLANTPELVHKMIDEGYIGRKGKGGFYRMDKTDGKKQMQSLDLSSGQYHAVTSAQLESLSAAKSGLREMISFDDRGGHFGWDVLSNTLSYAASLVPEICDDIHAVDEAIKLGYNWKSGPFELIDQLGTEWFSQRLENEGRLVPSLLKQLGSQNFYRIENGKRQQFSVDGQYHDIQRPDGVLLLADIKLFSKPLISNDSASLWDIGDGITCLEFHTKMNAMDGHIFDLISQSIELIKNEFKALVVYNEGRAFSAGANLATIKQMIEQQQWEEIRQFIQHGQRAYLALQQSPFPVVGAPTGLALGGGCEVMLHCNALQAHAETYAGLVELGVGLIPAWGGCKEMLKRWNQHIESDLAAMKAFQLISSARVSRSAADAREMGLLGEHDKITMNKDRLLADAKNRAIALAEDYQVADDITIPLCGESVKQQMNAHLAELVAAGKATAYDQIIATELASMLTGEQAGDYSEQSLFERELTTFDILMRKQGTLDRISHMLKTGKQLRN